MRGLLGVLLLAAAYDAPAIDCAFPKSPQKIPDGKTASESESESESEMVAAVSEFKQYTGDVTTYTNCLEQETSSKVREAGGAPSLVVQIKQLQAKKHNAAVDALQDKAKIFNEQIRAFKARK